MVFSKAIQIKLWVNKFNQERKRCGFAVIEFYCDMFTLGKWSIDLSLDGNGVFFSSEMVRFITLYAGGGFTMWIGSNGNSPVIHLQ